MSDGRVPARLNRTVANASCSGTLADGQATSLGCQGHGVDDRHREPLVRRRLTDEHLHRSRT